jgi:Mn2+/Fe2+ NRAMP family transporter
LIVSISRLTIVSGETLIHLIRLRFGKAPALIIIAGLMTTVCSSIIGVTAIAADVLQEWTRMFAPGGKGLHPAISSMVIIAILYYLFWFGKHGFFLRMMYVIVALMGISFIGSMLMVIPDASEIIRGMVPRIPEGSGSHLILAGLVGTTMAAVVVLSRTYLVAEQKWTLNDLKTEKRDAVVSMVLTFLVSASILAAAAGTMYPRGIVVDRAIDMVRTLEPITGPLASSIFVFGIIAAAFSSLFPGYLMGPWLMFDYRNKPRNMHSRGVRLGVLGIALLGLIVPVFQGNPVIIMIASQAVSPILMPLLILLIFMLINNKKIVGAYKNPLILNIGLGLTFVFSLFMAYTAYIGLSGFLSNL